MRLRRLVAVARMDLAQEMRGRGGWVLPAVMVGLLAPAAGAPGPRALLPSLPPAQPLPVSGAVPPEVASLAGVRVVERDGALQFAMQEGTLVARGPLPPEVRAALDGGAPAVRIEFEQRPIQLPQRSMLFALISGSSLTGAVSASIAGERSRRTLVALLSAAITRDELVAGKWLAWAGLGMASSTLAATGAILAGRIAPGPWLLPMLAVPAGTVALGLFLARRATDVIGGTTVSLRVIPASMALLGILAWVLGQSSPLVGAAVPLGGALLAAGATWPGLAPALVATASTLFASAAGLAWTSRELEEVPGTETAPSGARAAALGALLAGAAWTAPVLAPLLWIGAGNADLATRIPPSRGAFAGGLALLFLAAVRGARSTDARTELGLSTPRPEVLVWVLPAAIGMWAIRAATVGGWPTPSDHVTAAAALRLDAAMDPGWAGLGTLCLVLAADELVFRGWLQRAAGAPLATVVWVLVKNPLDPVHAGVVGVLCALLTRSAGGSVAPAFAARLLAALAAGLWLGG